ncbi:protein phosphatase inhibitor 2 family member C [Lepus europaeus]|uniref:protein phosphatase inhibitor 2 family member C n=1 Tax=Lepus europaeus TaxID=9983 RepID=UPI002B46C889|nr:protein phosphatase inhibitor 2 family member C [Lepus europaeus]
MASSSTSHRPIKGILKNKGSTASAVDASTQEPGGACQDVQRKKSQKWDESNILATTYKDYDFLKINEPSTTCVTVRDEGEDPMRDVKAKESMSVDMLAKKLAATHTSDHYYQVEEQGSCEAHTSKFSFQKQEKQRQFEMKRKLHYDEGLNIKLARQLISKDLQDEDVCDNEESLCQTAEEKTTTEEAAEASTGDELPMPYCHE